MTYSKKKTIIKVLKSTKDPFWTTLKQLCHK